MIIAIDFDGTIIEHGYYPNKGPLLPYAASVLKWLKMEGHKLILWTCRDGAALTIAVEQCLENGIDFDAINDNIASLPHLSKKVCANMYIGDDAWPQNPIDWKEIGKSFGMTEEDFKE